MAAEQGADVQRWVRRAVTGAAVLATAGALVLTGAASGSAPVEPRPADALAAVDDPLARAIAARQDELARAPGKDGAWAELGLLYLQQARVSADPTLYAKADGAFARSLALRPDGNDVALTGQAGLAVARHDFAGGLALAQKSLAVNDFSATTYGVLVDALVELGRYDEAEAAVRRMVDLRPGPDAYARASYLFELRGDVGRASAAMQAALDDSTAPADRAFAWYHLGELAWNAGDLAAARTHYEQGLAEDPSSATLLGGRAKVRAAIGDVAGALADYRAAVARQPVPQLLVELGELLEATGAIAAAEEQYDLVRATHRLYAEGGQDVDTELALFEADHGDPAVAVASAERAYRARPEAVLTQDAYAWALHAAGRDDEALLIARTAASTGLRLPAMRYRLGVLEAAAGDPQAAVAALRDAVQLNPAFSPLHAPRAHRLLDELS